MNTSFPFTDPEAALTRLYGQVPDNSASVVHVAAVWRAPGGDFITLRIGPDAPPSDIDWFVLSAARARADAIVTTGRILRAEPELVHDLVGETGAALHAWRQRALGRQHAPYVLVLTGGQLLDRAHPALHGWARPVIYTHTAAAQRMRAEGAGRLHIVGEDCPSLVGAITCLRGLGCRTILIEAGPSTGAALYRPDAPAIDELLLSVYGNERLPASARGPAFVEPDQIAGALPRRSPVYRDGDWQFMRFWRASTTR